MINTQINKNYRYKYTWVKTAGLPCSSMSSSSSLVVVLPAEKLRFLQYMWRRSMYLFLVVSESLTCISPCSLFGFCCTLSSPETTEIYLLILFIELTGNNCLTLTVPYPWRNPCGTRTTRIKSLKGPLLLNDFLVMNDCFFLLLLNT